LPREPVEGARLDHSRVGSQDLLHLRDVVVPGRLADGDEPQRLHRRAARATCSRAAARTRSGVKPNFFCSSLSGAEAPKGCMPMASPVVPTYRCQPKVEACSTETRAVTAGGRTLSRYSWLWRSNSSHEGMLTTRALMPSAASFS